MLLFVFDIYTLFLWEIGYVKLVVTKYALYLINTYATDWRFTLGTITWINLQYSYVPILILTETATSEIKSVHIHYTDKCGIRIRFERDSWFFYRIITMSTNDFWPKASMSCRSRNYSCMPMRELFYICVFNQVNIRSENAYNYLSACANQKRLHCIVKQ